MVALGIVSIALESTISTAGGNSTNSTNGSITDVATETPLNATLLLLTATGSSDDVDDDIPFVPGPIVEHTKADLLRNRVEYPIPGSACSLNSVLFSIL